MDNLQQNLINAFQSVALQVEHFVGVSTETLTLIASKVNETTSQWESPIHYTPFQFELLKLLLLILLLLSILIAVAWKTYGEVITDKFVRQSTLKEIEELKLSVSKLKLPKEHSPRI